MYKFTHRYKHHKYTYDYTRTPATTNRSISASISTGTHKSAHTITSTESANLRPKAAPAGGGLRRKRAHETRINSAPSIAIVLLVAIVDVIAPAILRAGVTAMDAALRRQYTRGDE